MVDRIGYAVDDELFHRQTISLYAPEKERICFLFPYRVHVGSSSYILSIGFHKILGVLQLVKQTFKISKLYNTPGYIFKEINISPKK